MAAFTSETLTDSRFEDVYLTDARFHDVDLTGVTIRGATQVTVDISGEIKNLRVNGVDVVPLVLATDAWVQRAILGEPSPWDPLDLPHDEMPDQPAVPRDRDARPSLDDVLALLADRMGTARRVIER